MDKDRLDQLILDIISAGKFNNADMLELAVCCHVVELSCIATVAAEIGDIDGFSEKVRRAINRAVGVVDGG